MRHTQQRIIAELGVRPTINPSEEIERRTAFLANYLGASAATGYVLGISGGQDSLLAGILAQRAVRQLRSEGREAEFHAALLPYGTQADRADALWHLMLSNPMPYTILTLSQPSMPAPLPTKPPPATRSPTTTEAI